MQSSFLFAIFTSLVVQRRKEKMIAVIIGLVCAGIFMLVGPAGIVLVGLMLIMAGVSNKEKD